MADKLAATVHPLPVEDPFPANADPFGEPFGAFMMSEFHAPYVEQRITFDELAAVPGQVACTGIHGLATRPDLASYREFTAYPCPECGAAV